MNVAAPKPTASSCIGLGMSIAGDVVCAGPVQVFGRLAGDLHAGDVVIGGSGVVEGNVTAQEVIIKGRLKGTVRASRVKLQGHAAVDGVIFHHNLSIEEFALFEGTSWPLFVG